MLCACGCGRWTPIAKKTDRRRGTVRGRPLRFVNGHSGGQQQRREYTVCDMGYGTPCWVWDHSCHPNGYAQTRDGATMALAHRVFYEERYGQVPAGLVLDHRCRVRNCVNPDHLEPVTQSVNVRRGAGRGGVLSGR